MIKLMSVIWQAVRLSKLAKSRTTKDAFAGNAVILLIVCAVVAGVGAFVDIDTDTAITIITGAVAILSPLAARVAVKVHQEFDVSPDVMLIKVKRGKNAASWMAHTGCLRDAALAGWTEGVTVDGDIVSIQPDGSGRKLGMKIALPHPDGESAIAALREAIKKDE